jgi:ABC-type antimicrobial peptide transport system permease subunit
MTLLEMLVVMFIGIAIGIIIGAVGILMMIVVNKGHLISDKEFNELNEVENGRNERFKPKCNKRNN